MGYAFLREKDVMFRAAYFPRPAVRNVVIQRSPAYRSYGRRHCLVEYANVIVYPNDKIDVLIILHYYQIQ